jgi:hypothetical protein
MLVLSLYCPSAAEWLIEKLGATAFFAHVAEAQKQKPAENAAVAK